MHVDGLVLFIGAPLLGQVVYEVAGQFGSVEHRIHLPVQMVVVDKVVAVFLAVVVAKLVFT